MNDFSRPYGAAPSMDMSVDAGLRSFMLGVYNKMGLGLAVSGLLAFAVASIEPVRALFFVQQFGQLPSGEIVSYYSRTMLGMIVAFSPLGAILLSMFMMRNPSKSGANLLYWFVVATMGAGLAIWGLNYTGQSVAQVFFITAAAFGGMSLWGYTTKKDLSGFGSFLIMGVIGLIIAMVVNFFLGSSLLMMGISVLGVLIFAGLTAYDTQRLKVTYYQLQGDSTAMSVATSFGALSLYINFINMFQFLMMLLGSRE